jgi:hypothetical protein
MDGPEPTTTAKAAIDIFILLTINHSLGSAERERASAWVLLFGGQGPPAWSPGDIVASCG